MKILKKRGGWTFGGSTPLKFENHIKQSVPFYEEGHELIKNLSDYFLLKILIVTILAALQGLFFRNYQSFRIKKS